MQLTRRFEPVGLDLWGADHFALLAYIRHFIMAHRVFHVGFDSRMRWGAHHFRALRQAPPSPLRPDSAFNTTPVMSETFSTTLSGQGQRIAWHDDWDCFLDLAAADMLRVPDPLEIGHVAQLSEAGFWLSERLCRHLEGGGNFQTFQIRRSICQMGDVA